MFLLREVFPDDLDALHAVAAHLNSVNLPNDRAVLEKLVDQSKRSFAGQLDVFKRLYMFALLDGEKLIGTSMIHAQHGTRRAPHIFFDVLADERYSETLDRHFVHQVLRIGYNYNGPTEIGGLILLPAYRRHDYALGRWLSYVRFLYIALHRDRFRDEVLSELMPPLGTDGTSALWECLGRHFTGMDYQEADRISQTNKEFIRSLFPAEPIYTAMLPKSAQALIGQVGPETKGVEKMLRRIGFQYAERIDPFDGGPHFIAKTDEVTLVKATTKARVFAVDGADDGRPFGLVSAERDAPPHFRATGSRFRLEGAEVGLPEPTRRALGVQAGDEVGVLTFGGPKEHS
jgi:arginine N-succinyltransferase